MRLYHFECVCACVRVRAYVLIHSSNHMNRPIDDTPFYSVVIINLPFMRTLWIHTAICFSIELFTYFNSELLSRIDCPRCETITTTTKKIVHVHADFGKIKLLNVCGVAFDTILHVRPVFFVRCLLYITLFVRLCFFYLLFLSPHFINELSNLNGLPVLFPYAWIKRLASQKCH